MRPARRTLLALPAALPAALTVRGAAAQPRAIRLVVPFGAGSTTDIIARIAAEHLGIGLGVPVAVENRPGAGGLIGAEHVARARPDGTVLGIGSVASHAVAPAMIGRPPVDPVADFTAVMMLARAPALLAAHRSLGIRTVAELRALAAAQGPLTFTSGGQGTVAHLAGEVLRARQGLALRHVPYRDVGLALADATSGRIQLMSYQEAPLRPYLAAGHLVPILGLGSRLPTLPDLPLARDAFGDATLDFDAWFGLFLPAGAPAELAQKIHEALAPRLAAEASRSALLEQGFTVSTEGPDSFGPFVRAEAARWAAIVRETPGLP